MPPSENPYDDVPLNLGRKNIRLVTLEHGDMSGPIKCILQSHALDECPAYVALSYAWGAKQRHDNIQINGSSFPVGRNLWHFLHQMRMQRQHVSYWIDAISIDQANVFEQSHQVQMMREIYTQACSVWVWLGEADHSTSSDVAMRYLSKRAVWSGRDVDLRRFWSARKAKAVLELCERGYWRRIWIVQEVLLAKHIQILCGGYCVEWAKLQQLLEDFQAISDRGRSLHVYGVPAVLESSAAIIIRAKAQWNGVPQPFTLLLEQYHRQHSTDVRDKVYALHGLASDSDWIPINYRIDPEQLLAQMICHACSPLAPKTGMKRSRTDLFGFAELMQESLKIFCNRGELGRHIALARWNSTIFCNFDSSRVLSRRPLGPYLYRDTDDMYRYRDKSLDLRRSDPPERAEVAGFVKGGFVEHRFVEDEFVENGRVPDKFMPDSSVQDKFMPGSFVQDTFTPHKFTLGGLFLPEGFAEETYYYCDRRGCRRSFNREREFYDHARTHAEIDCVIDDCNHRFNRKDQLWDHIWHSHRNMLQSLSLSRKMFDTPPCRGDPRKRRVAYHSRTHHKTNPYTLILWDWRWNSLRIAQLDNPRCIYDPLRKDFYALHWECRLNECSCKYITRQ